MPSCHSTNDIALEMARNSDITEGTVIITDDQTEGRGQRGNSWHASPGKNITLSLLLKPKFLEASKQYPLNMAISLAVLKTVNDQLADNEASIKWPNDIYVGRRKIAGMLIENGLSRKTLDYSVIGIGLNVNQSDFGGLQATSLKDELDKDSDLELIFQKLVENVEAYYLQLKAGKSLAIKEEYLRSLLGYRSKLKFRTEYEFEGTIQDVTESGQLSVSINGRSENFSFKEIDFIL
ncbi:biotin--[acetyl-CoA-carboxylase] ligase [Roseivirga sp. E12]|uniref:biotin--[acetyl-CoA-carboxylase] ligase n=1 Tax=Roseivirga sp. E12 TaxID=2819237 RepID=UPI001ABD04C4|nr:biotin--[acetyl-CoA-carboxylase] ligase [Roseivirga sp. E12]MBO3698543.1 biotin--[acetyl-CoA-carboxylase] ligase [Roseivirga sp. E12]